MKYLIRPLGAALMITCAFIALLFILGACFGAELTEFGK